MPTRNPTRNPSFVQRICIDPAICGGRPCIRGTRVSVSDILNMIAEGATPDDIVNGYPYLDKRDIAAALTYAARALDYGAVQPP